MQGAANIVPLGRPARKQMSLEDISMHNIQFPKACKVFDASTSFQKRALSPAEFPPRPRVVLLMHHPFNTL